VIVFRLPDAGPLRVEIVQVAPSCRRVGTLTLRGRAGVNRFRFAGRFRGRALPPGTYVLSAAGKRVPVAVRRSGPPVRLRTLATNACSFAAAVETHPGESRLRSTGIAAPIRETPPPRPDPRRDVLGFSGVAEAAESIAELHPAFFVLLGLAVALLAIASIPSTVIPHPAAATAVAKRRIELTLTGVIALAAVITAYLLVLI